MVVFTHLPHLGQESVSNCPASGTSSPPLTAPPLPQPGGVLEMGEVAGGAVVSAVQGKDLSQGEGARVLCEVGSPVN